MIVVKIPDPPNPEDYKFRMDPLSYNRETYRWMKEVKGKLEQAGQQNNTPLDQNFVVSSYALTTALSSASTTSDVANFVCSLVAAFTRKGITRSINSQT